MGYMKIHDVYANYLTNTKHITYLNTSLDEKHISTAQYHQIESSANFTFPHGRKAMVHSNIQNKYKNK